MNFLIFNSQYTLTHLKKYIFLMKIMALLNIWDRTQFTLACQQQAWSVPLLWIACSHRIRSRSRVQASFASRLTAWSVYVSWVFLFLNQISKHRPLSPLLWVRPMSVVYGKEMRSWRMKILQAAMWQVSQVGTTVEKNIFLCERWVNVLQDKSNSQPSYTK